MIGNHDAAGLISTRRFRHLPNARDRVVINGVTLTVEVDGREKPMPRWMWIHKVCQAVIMSQTPGGRYNLRRDGFLKFQKLAGVLLPMLSPISLDTNETRAVWDGMMEYIKRHEWHLQAGLKKLYEIERTKLSADIPILDEPEVKDDNPEVEAIRDGSLRKVAG
jgi:hypothetical protein